MVMKMGAESRRVCCQVTSLWLWHCGSLRTCALARMEREIYRFYLSFYLDHQLIVITLAVDYLVLTLR